MADRQASDRIADRPVVNAFEIAVEGDPEDPPGYHYRAVKTGPLLDSELIVATVYELDPGESVCPYHYEHGNEEWLLVLAGHPMLRDPGGEHTLDPGDLVVFAEGPDGAHKVTGRGEEPCRIIIFSTDNQPSTAVYPDSGKIGVWPPGKLFREADAVGYYDGEPGVSA